MQFVITNPLAAPGKTKDGSPALILTGAVLVSVVDDDVAGLLGALGVGQLVLVVAVDVVVVAGGAGRGEERPDEVHGRGGEGAAAEAEEKAGDDDEDVLGAVLDGRDGDFRLGGGEGHGAADLVRAEAEDGDDGGGERRGVGTCRGSLLDGDFFPLCRTQTK